MSDTVQAPDNLLDAIEGAVWICDAADVEPIANIEKIVQSGAHGVSETQGLIVTTTDGKRYHVVAREMHP